MARIIISSIFLFLSFTGSAQTKDLNYFLGQAVQNSPLLKDFGLQQASNRIDSLRLRASMLPGVNGNGTATYAPYFNGFGYDPALSNYHTLTTVITVSKPILNKANINNQLEAFRLTDDSLATRAKISEQQLKWNITKQYILVYGETQQLKFTRDMLHLLHQEEKLLKKLTEKSVYKQTDFLAFLVTIQQQELALSQANIQYRNDLATLNYLSGLNDTVFTELPEPVLDLSQLPPLDQTIFYQQYKIDSLKTLNNDRQIDFSYKPRWNVYADGGYSSTFESMPYKNFGVSAGVTLVVPIYDGKQKKMLHNKNQIEAETKKNYLEFQKIQYEQQKNQLYEQLQLAEAMIKQADAQIRYTEVLMEAQRKQLATGDVHITDYIVAIGNYLNAKNVITQNTINRLQIINQLNYPEGKN